METQGSGVMGLLFEYNVVPSGRLSMTLYSSLETALFISVSTFINIILAALIVFRLVYHRRRVKKVLGAEHGILYTNVMTMCVESSALMVIISGVYVVLLLVTSWALYTTIPGCLYSHICVRRLELNDI